MQRDTTRPERQGDQLPLNGIDAGHEPTLPERPIVDATMDTNVPDEKSVEGELIQAPANQPVERSKGSGSSRRTATSQSQSSTESKNGRAPTPGAELEIRLARMHFWKGSYARNGVNLQHHFYPEPLIVTDLDLLAIQLTPQLAFAKTVGEAKSGTGKSAPKPLDRAIWVAGLKQLVGANEGLLLTAAKPSARVRETVRKLGVQAFSVDELDRWEKAHLTSALADVGAHGRGAFIAAENARVMAKGEPGLERIYWFLRSEVWFLDSWQAAKRLIGAMRELRQWWTPTIDDSHAAALRWMYAESISNLTLHLVGLVGIYQSSDMREWPTTVRDRLSEGAVPAHNMRALAEAFDRYLAHVLAELKAPATVQVETTGAFHPSPPDWAESFMELLGRLESFSQLRELPRQTDLVITERLVRRRHASQEALVAVSSTDPEEFARERRLIAAFLRGCIEVPDAVDKAMTA